MCSIHDVPIELLHVVLNKFCYEHVPLWRHVCADWNDIWTTHCNQRESSVRSLQHLDHCSVECTPVCSGFSGMSSVAADLKNHDTSNEDHHCYCDRALSSSPSSSCAGAEFDAPITICQPDTGIHYRRVVSIVSKSQVHPVKSTKLRRVEQYLKQKCIRQICIPTGSVRILAYHGHLNALQWVHSLRLASANAQGHARPWKRSGLLLELACIAAYYGHLDIVNVWLTVWNSDQLLTTTPSTNKEDLNMSSLSTITFPHSPTSYGGVNNYHIHFITECAARGGHGDIIDHCAAHFANSTAVDYEQPAELLKQAARGGHSDLFEQIVRRCHQSGNPICMHDKNIAMCAAARGGHMRLVRHCIETHGCSNIYMALVRAARGGHVVLAKMLIDEYSATSFNMAMAMAAKGGHFELMLYLRDTGGSAANDVNLAFAHAAGGGHESIVRFCHDVWQADAVEYAMRLAAVHGHASIVRICHDEWGARNVAEALEEATIAGHIDVVRLCREEWNAHWVVGRSTAHAVPLAAQFGHFQLFRRLVDVYGLAGIESGMMAAALVDNKRMVRFIRRQYPHVPIQAALLAATGSNHLGIVQWLLRSYETQQSHVPRVLLSFDTPSNMSTCHSVAASYSVDDFVDQIVFVSVRRNSLEVMNWIVHQFQVKDIDTAYNRGAMMLIRQCMQEHGLADKAHAIIFLETSLYYGGSGL